MPRSKLTQRADGRYRCWYKGKQFYGNTMREAYAKRDEYKRAIEGGENPDRITVRAYAEYWFPVAKAALAPQSRYMEHHLLDILLDDIGDMPIKSVRPGNIKAVYTDHFLGLSEEYISHARSIYSSMFDSAVGDGYIRINPCKQKSARPHKGTVGSHRAITQEERHILETCATNHRTYPVAMIMLYAGLRPAEAQALHMKDVDFDKKIIRVCASYHAVEGSTNKRQRTAKMKTDTSRRIVPLFSPLAECLRGRTGLIISQDDGGLTRTAWRNAWVTYMHAIQRETGTDFYITPYDLRHTFCTWCRDNGVELHTCVEWMGHKDAKMIMKIYDSVTKDRFSFEAERLENIIKNGTKKA